MHKQTAAWYSTKKNHRLSSDRLVHVQKTNKQKWELFFLLSMRKSEKSTIIIDN
jgi:hypothetical protein